ncbi:hypothetical protein UUU_13780 [Klebsiella pneumoniae subsp. pneumoniae DSM 30104 = JCM 1662 = NBRC 14940]|nr:hypothetical protein UUU_13780 [Klebsiella pneumoniae subsp. pneumoniae DSM 30104 = JCM 1662 = NBRC 14940]
MTIRMMLTRVASSQPRVVAKPPRIKFKIFRMVRIKPRFCPVDNKT